MAKKPEKPGIKRDSRGKLMKGSAPLNGAGAKKGSNHRVTRVQRVMEKAGLDPDKNIDPLVFMQLIVNADAERLGLVPEAERDLPPEERTPGYLLIPMEARFASAKELATYMYAKVSPKPDSGGSDGKGGGVMRVAGPMSPEEWAAHAAKQQEDLRNYAHQKVLEHDPGD